MNVKKTLEEIGFLAVKIYIMDEEYHWDANIHEYNKLTDQIEKLIKQVKDSIVDLNPAGKTIPHEKKIISDRIMMEKNIENWTKSYEEDSKRPLPSEVKEQMKRLL